MTESENVNRNRHDEKNKNPKDVIKSFGWDEIKIRSHHRPNYFIDRWIKVIFRFQTLSRIYVNQFRIYFESACVNHRILNLRKSNA